MNRVAKVVRPKVAKKWFAVTPAEEGKLLYMDAPKEGQEAAGETAKAETAAAATA